MLRAMTWINGLSGGQLALLCLVVAACVFFPAHYATQKALRRYGRRAMPYVAAVAGFCAVAIVVLLTLAYLA